MVRIFSILCLLAHGACASVYYIDSLATGNNDGSSWTHAWTNTYWIRSNSFTGDDIIFISGGTTSKVYTSDIRMMSGGTAGHPITIRPGTNSPHNGTVIISNAVALVADYVTLTGSKNPAYSTNLNPFQLDSIKSNISMIVSGPVGDADAISVTSAGGCGVIIEWLEIRGWGQPTTGENAGGRGVWVEEVQEPDPVVVRFCWIHDNWGHGVAHDQTKVSARVGFGRGRYHHLLQEGRCDDFFHGSAGFYDIWNCMMRNQTEGIGHPDSYQGPVVNVRIWNCVMRDTLGGIRFELSGDQLTNLFFYNNYLYFPTNDLSEGGPVLTDHENDVGSSFTMSNFVFANNTFACAATKITIVHNSTDHPDLTNIFLRAWTVKNNIFHGTAGSAADAAISLIRGNCDVDYTTNDVQFDYNIISGVQKTIGYKDTNNFYADAEAFNSAYPALGHNRSASPTFVDTNAPNWAISISDSNARQNGTSLSALTDCIDIDKDILGNSRSGTFWDAGAFVFDTNLNLKLWLNFEGTTWTNTLEVRDQSGFEHHGYGVTNVPYTFTGHYIPQIVPGVEGANAANFRLHGTNEQFQVYQKNLGYQIGDWLGITNLNYLDNLTNGTFACWVLYTNDTQEATVFSAGWDNVDNSWEITGYDTEFDQAIVIYTNAVRIRPVRWDNPLTNWQHVAITWSCTDSNIIGYTNSVPFIASTLIAPSLRLATDANNLLIGATTHGGTWLIDTNVDDYPNNAWFTGYLDDLRVYDRRLSSAEITQLYNGGGAAASESGSTPSPTTAVTFTNVTIGTLFLR